tara:strand:+ start:85 stop:570 length:486 start_codon:yes stop_codon:yes gene_type:complete
MDLSKRIHDLIDGSINELGYEIVRVKVFGNENVVLQVMAEPKNGDRMTAENCSTISRAISALLDVEDPIRGTYNLEVSSPGLDRPLTRLKDFERFKGKKAKIETDQIQSGRRRFKGSLLGVDGKNIKILVDTKEVKVAFSNIRNAKLLMTNELIETAEDNR